MCVCGVLRVRDKKIWIGRQCNKETKKATDKEIFWYGEKGIQTKRDRATEETERG